MAEPSAALERLRRLRGIAAEFTDFRGRRHAIATASLRRLLGALGHSEDDARALQQQADALELRDWIRVLPPVVVLRGNSPVVFTVLAPLLPAIRWRVATEPGEVLEGEIDPAALPVVAERGVGELWYLRLALELPELPPGYHRLTLAKPDGSPLGTCRLLVAPAGCHEPPAIQAGERLWGMSIQLYALRSGRNWGIGDFTDLAGFATAAAALGADMIGLNPLHALFPADPARCAPYSPSSREFLNVLYIDPEAVPEYPDCPEAQRLVGRPEFQARLEALRAMPFVDYAGVTRCKLEVLRALYRWYERSASGGRRQEFKEFLKERGEALDIFALFHALHAHFTAAGEAGGWPAWPVDYHDPRGAAARAFREAEPEAVRFHCWLQWVAAGQLAAAEAAARQAGMRVGLYCDLAVGPADGGAETWADPGLYAAGASIGAPPDELAPQGQDWGIPPMHPDTLREAAYQPFARLLRANMPPGGALRIDHVMMLHRLWWVPAGCPSAAGGYVHYRLDELMAIVALESQRQGCLVIGEDLGTVPPEVRDAMCAHGLYSYRVLFFERHDDGSFRRPGDYPRAALVTISTHDLPPLASFWSGSDIALRERLGLYTEPGQADEERAARAATRRALLMALATEQLLPEGYSPETDAPGAPAPALLDAVQRYLARTPATMLMLQPEDWLGMSTPVNVPGTHETYPNWARKLTADWPDLMGSEIARAMAAGLFAEGRGRAPG